MFSGESHPSMTIEFGFWTTVKEKFGGDIEREDGLAETFAAFPGREFRKKSATPSRNRPQKSPGVSQSATDGRVMTNAAD
jgi:hypothetical protein